MKNVRISIWEKDEYTYQGAFGFIPFIKGYLQENDEKRPGMIIAPGGGYVFLSPVEAELIAKKFYRLGFQVFVCVYTVNTLMKYPLRKQPLKDLAKTVQIIRSHSDEWHVYSNRIVVFGASAGGHLTGSLSVHFDDIGIEGCRPDAVVMAYPVVSTEPELIHKASFQALLGDTPDGSEQKYMSVEKNVSPDMPPCFIWHTATDSEVSVQNSMKLADACFKNKVLYACHIFSEGEHGMALADSSVDSRDGEADYVFEQQECIMREMENGRLALSDEQKAALKRVLSLRNPDYICTENRQISKWTEMVMDWLDSFLL